MQDGERLSRCRWPVDENDLVECGKPATGPAEVAGLEFSAVYPMPVCDEHYEASRLVAGTDPG